MSNSLPPARRVTFSPSWTLIPTHYCRNTCGYCVFVSREGAAAELISPRSACSEMEQARQAGAAELLMMSGEGVENSPRVRAQLRDYNFASYLDYLLFLAARALDHDLLPHINVGNLNEAEFRALRRFVPSMGMMLESTRVDLLETAVHRRAPDKEPRRRLATLAAAGRARVPFTTGLLIGIGETVADWAESLRAIKSTHEKYGHIQEVIIQPFTPHRGTAMEDVAPPRMDVLAAAVQLAREILPSEVAVQIPPNLAPEFVSLIEAGATDLGGISPDGDRINPDERWETPARYARILARHNYRLTPRLAVHDRFLSPAWLSAETLAAAERVRARLPRVTGA